MNRRLYSSLAVAAFERERIASSPCGCGASALAAPRRSAPASSRKPSRRAFLHLLPHENEILECACISVDKFLELVAKMNQKATAQMENTTGIAKLCFFAMARRAQKCQSHIPNEVSHTAFEGFGKFRQRFESNFLFRPFDVANVVPRQIGFLRQFLLTQMRLSPFGADGFSQNTINSARRRIHSFP